MAGAIRKCFAWAYCIFMFCIAYKSQMCRSQTGSAASFIFGDSLVDAGNNNYIFSLSKADNVPNGIDFAASGGRPNGRYTNGRTIPDILGQDLGAEAFSPPYLAPSTRGEILVKAGVNYASGGGGILQDTGKLFIGRLSMDAQIDNFANTREELISMLGTEGAKEFLGHSIFSVTMGSNDFLNNYLVPTNVAGRKQVTPEEFVQSLIHSYRPQLTRLYNLDARKILVANVGPIGCIPYQRATVLLHGADDCVSLPNQMALSFNSQLKDLIMELNADLPGATFVYANVYDIVADIIANYDSYGFEVADTACCGGGGQYKGIIPCGAAASVCPDHSKNVFWDPYHPSEATNAIIAGRLLDGGPDICFPMNLRQLKDS